MNACAVNLFRAAIETIKVKSSFTVYGNIKGQKFIHIK